MNDEILAAIVHDTRVAVYAVQDGNDDIGIVELNWRDAPNCEIAFFGIVEEAVGGGVGRWTMAEVQRVAFDDGAARLWLHTCTHDHPRALPFYVAQGFRPYRREIEIALDPRLSGNVRRDAAAFHPIIEG